MVDRLPLGYVAKLKSEDSPAVRRGLVLTLGALPRSLYTAVIQAQLPTTAAGVTAPAAAASSATITGVGGGGGGGGAGGASGTSALASSTPLSSTPLEAVINALITATRQVGLRGCGAHHACLIYLRRYVAACARLWHVARVSVMMDTITLEL